MRQSRKAQSDLYAEQEERAVVDRATARKVVWEQLQKHLPFIAEEMMTNDMLQNLDAITLDTPDGHFCYRRNLL